jgi:hypothetical protein
VESSGREEVRRAVEGQALKARLDAAIYERKLREKPFWRFRRRQAIGKALADARLREQEALALLGDEAAGADEAESSPR